MTVGVGLAGVTKVFGPVRALDGVDLEVPPGMTMAILGPSGCGKTTLLRLVAGLDAPDGGTIRFDGRDVTAEPPAARDVAMVFQDHALMPHLSVADNIVFGLRARKLARAEVGERLADAAQVSGCAHLLDRWPAQLSGGEHQRVALARAVARRPAVLLLDEPLASLDVQLRARLRLDLRRVLGQVGVTTLHVTHDQAEAQALGQRVAVVAGGRVHQVGTPDEIYERPADRFVAGFVGSPGMNLLPVAGGPPPRAGPFPLAGRRLGDGPVDAGIRAEAITLAGPGVGVPGRVEATDPVGADALVTVDAAGYRVVVVVPRRDRPRVGESVSLTAAPDAFVFFDGVTGLAVPAERRA